MDDMTTHSAVGYGVERGLYRTQGHYDANGVARFGAAGTPVASLVADSYRREADGLMADLRKIAAAMLSGDRHTGSTDAPSLAHLLIKFGREIIDLAVPEETERPVGAGWTADYSDGGRPFTGEAEAIKGLVDGYWPRHDVPDASRMAIDDYPLPDQPVPDAPDLSAAGRDDKIPEPVDGMTDAELDEIDRARAAATTEGDGDRS